MFKNPISDSDLYKKLINFEFSKTDDELTFAQRLQRENLWSERLTEEVIFEYKRFLFLAATCSHPITPSEKVDQAWHLHLLYSSSYWDDLCNKVLKFPLHHNPTKGGDKEQAKFIDWYAKTLESYERVFAEKPSKGIWEAVSERFPVNDSTAEKGKLKKKIRCSLHIFTILFFIILFLVFLGAFQLPFIFIIPYFLAGLFFYNMVFGKRCDQCCRNNAMEVISKKELGNKRTVISKCKYCQHHTTVVSDTTPAGGGGCGGCGCGGS